MSKKSEPKFIPVDLETKGKESLSEGKCELKRVSYNIVGDVQSLVLQFQPAQWTYSIMVDITEDAPVFTQKTPWKEILKKPITAKFMWLGKNYKAIIRKSGKDTAEVDVMEPASINSFKKTPFASFSVALEEKDDAVRMTVCTAMDVGGKPCIGLVIGGTPMNIGKRSFGNITKISPEPKGRRYTATELYDSMYDALVNCDEKFVDVVAYKADTSNPVSFRITDEDDHDEDVRDLKFQLIDGRIDVVNIKPSGCVETTYAIVPVDGDM
jgi:hypothetical protein